MIPKTIHLCWFSEEPFPVEIKICLDTWKRILPDFKIRHWGYKDAKEIGCRFIDEALKAKQWAFAADAVRFYAVYKEGGIYMDSDIFMKQRFDSFIPKRGFATFHDHMVSVLQLQAAFFMGEVGNEFCKRVFNYYQRRPFIRQDGTYDKLVSPQVMLIIAREMGYRAEDVEQHLENDTVVYPGYYVTPCKKNVTVSPNAFAQHRIYGSWRKRKMGRRFELFVKHHLVAVRYAIFKR